MEIFFLLALAYLLIGLMYARKHIRSGRVGSKGVGVTMIAVTMLWPIIALRA